MPDTTLEGAENLRGLDSNSPGIGCKAGVLKSELGIFDTDSLSKYKDMVIVRIDDDSEQAKAVVEMLKTFAFAEVDEAPRYNEETEQAIRDARAGKTEKFDLTEFRKQLYS